MLSMNTKKPTDPKGAPTILFDEIDTVFGPRAKENEEIRGLLNAGHRRGAVAGRCVVKGKIVETEEIPAYCAVALAGLGGLPDTLLSRSVIVGMRRRASGEMVEPYRRKIHAPEGAELCARLGDWAASVRNQVDGALPDMPDGIEYRNADMWEPLLAVADAGGGGWSAAARVAAVALVADSKESTPSLGVPLLADLHTVFADRDVLTTTETLAGLNKLDESPWADLYGNGKSLNARGLANRLRQYGVKSTNVRIGEWVGKGYKREDLHDPWTRYLPWMAPNYVKPKQSKEEVGEPLVGPPADRSATSATTATSQVSESMPTREVARLEPPTVAEVLKDPAAMAALLGADEAQP